MSHSTTKAAWRTVLGGLSAARKYVPERAIVAGAQAKTFTVEQAPKAAGAAVNFAGKNPSVAVSAFIGTAGLIVFMAPNVVSAPVLLATGFSSSGVGAGTIAAGVQSSIGNVAAGSVFATLQSAGTGGAGLAVVNGVAQVGGCAMAAAGSGLAFLKSKMI